MPLVSRSIVTMLMLALSSGLVGCSEKRPVAERPAALAPEPAAAPGMPEPTGKIVDLMGPDWKLESFDGGEPVPAGIGITFGVSVERLNGNGGCNRYMGSIKIGEAPGQLVIGPLASTEMACAPAANAAETRYLTALQHARSFTVRDGKLFISYADGDTARTLTYSR